MPITTSPSIDQQQAYAKLKALVTDMQAKAANTANVTTDEVAKVKDELATYQSTYSASVDANDVTKLNTALDGLSDIIRENKTDGSNNLKWQQQATEVNEFVQEVYATGNDVNVGAALGDDYKATVLTNLQDPAGAETLSRLNNFISAHKDELDASWLEKANAIVAKLSATPPQDVGKAEVSVLAALQMSNKTAGATDAAATPAAAQDAKLIPSWDLKGADAQAKLKSFGNGAANSDMTKWLIDKFPDQVVRTGDSGEIDMVQTGKNLGEEGVQFMTDPKTGAGLIYNPKQNQGGAFNADGSSLVTPSAFSSDKKRGEQTAPYSFNVGDMQVNFGTDKYGDGKFSGINVRSGATATPAQGAAIGSWNLQDGTGTPAVQAMIGTAKNPTDFDKWIQNEYPDIYAAASNSDGSINADKLAKTLGEKGFQVMTSGDTALVFDPSSTSGGGFKTNGQSVPTPTAFYKDNYKKQDAAYNFTLGDMKVVVGKDVKDNVATGISVTKAS